MGILMKINRNRIVRHMARNCTPFLVSSYGPQISYTPGQIDRAIEETGYNIDHIDYAYAMFGKSEDFPSLSSNNFDDLKEEISEIFFDGNSDFNAQDFIASSSGSDSAFGGDGFADGGDGGD